LNERPTPGAGGYRREERKNRLGAAQQERSVALGLNTSEEIAIVDEESVEPTLGDPEPI
jgi:hypothetical protein